MTQPVPNDGIRHPIDDVTACDILHQMSSFYTGTKKPHDYGTGEAYTAWETHVIKYIADHPGVTLTDMALAFGKTKGAFSQIVNRLVARGLIVKNKAEGMDNRQFLELSEKGLELNAAHEHYDAIHFGESMSVVRSQYTDEEVDKAFTILMCWLDARRALHKKRIEQQKASGNGSF